jgi:hypothetical protein
MKRKKRLLLAGSIAAAVMLAVPALAMATVWMHGEEEVSEFIEFAAVGGELFETTSGNGMSCEARAVFTTEGGTTGTVTKFEIKKCPTGFGSFASCKFKSGEGLGEPWITHTNGSELTITNMRTKRTFESCGTSELDKTITSVAVKLDVPAEIDEMNLSGSIAGFKTNSTLFVEGENSKTFGIG